MEGASTAAGVEAVRVRAAPGVLRLLASFRERFDETLEGTVSRICADMPAYADGVPGLVESVRDHVSLHFEALLTVLAEDRQILPGDLDFVRPAATHRARHGVPFADFMHAFRIGQLQVWEGLAAGIADEETREAAVSVVGRVIEYVNVASAHGAEVYAEVEQLLHAHGERVRRDLLGDLLEGRVPEPGPRLQVAREAGLEPGSTCLVVAAAVRGRTEDAYALRSAASAIGRACGGKVAPLVVVRREEIVAVVAAAGRDLRALGDALHGVQDRFAAQGLVLAVGVSTPLEGLPRVRDAYREACTVRELLGAEGGVVALPAMSAFDYLTVMGADVAQRLIPEPVRAFVEEDLADGGILSHTLLEYVASDLNARAASRRLFVHVNTVHYRLGRIAERTGHDLRRTSDLLELLLAVKLAQVRRAA